MHGIMEHLQERLAGQEQQTEHLSQEIRARDWERWQLLQLLHEKDASIVRQRATLSSTMGSSRFYRVLCSWRAWREYVRQRGFERARMRSRAQCMTLRLRHACDLMRVVLKHAASRQLESSMHVLRQQIAPKGLDLPPVPPLPHGVDACSVEEGDLSCSVTPPTPERPRCAPRSACGDAPEDIVVFATPRRQSPGHRRQQPPWESNPVAGVMRGCAASSPSEVSTYAPSSLAQSFVTASSVSSLGPRQHRQYSCFLLAQALDRACDRRSAWGFMRLARVAALKAQAAGLATEATAVASQLAEAQLSARQSRDTELQASEHWESERQAAARDLHALELRVSGRWEQECTEFRREQAAVRDSVASELRTAERWKLASEALQQEQAASDRLREEMRDTEHRLIGQSDKSERHLLHAEARLGELQEQLASGGRWRQEVEQRMRRMVSCGEDLERERAQLRRELKEAQQMKCARDEQVEQLQDNMEQEQQLGEILKARVRVLEEDGVDLSVREDLERTCRREDAAKHQRQHAALERELVQTREALRGANRGCELAEARATQAVRRESHAEHERERASWAKAIARMEEEVSHMRAELDAEQRQHAAEQVAIRRNLKSESEAGKKAEASLTHALCRQESLEKQLAQMPIAVAPASMERHDAPSRPGGLAADVDSRASTPQPSTPQLQELDNYAELVEQLQKELSRERAEREASAKSLSSLRTSYRLLLQRGLNCGCGKDATSAGG